ncbi:MAG: hypothetical protein HKL90_08450 [Elusimicrobia bacterium]|nr:hypothetical protein [Elusimicrobiota bacterium]
MRRFALLLAAAALCACGEDISYQPAPQILPINIQKLGLQQIINNTQQFGIEDKLGIAIRDQFLSDDRYPIVPVKDANGVVIVTITLYQLIPIQYDATLNPTTYKLRIDLDVQMLDRASNTVIWDEKNLNATLVFPTSVLAGGLTEEQGREQLYPILATKVVKRVIDGFGSVSHDTQRRLSSDSPSSAPTTPEAPASPITPVMPAPY